MYQLDKDAFGGFLAALRREKGLTQRQLAETLFVSDKAVSKWERGLSIPDPALLIPLAEALGVTVTELLLCRRCPQAQPMTAAAVEQAVQTAITYPGSKAPRAFQAQNRRQALWFLLALAAGAAGMYGCHRWGGWSENLLLSVLLAAGFGGYFWLLVPLRLPDLYDQHPIGFFCDGILRMHLPGLALNNQNWPRVVLAARVWACLALCLLPLLHLAAALWAPAGWMGWLEYVSLFLLLGGLFLPMYAAGRH